MKALESAFNQEKVLVGAFSMIIQLRRLIVCTTTKDIGHDRDSPRDHDHEVHDVPHVAEVAAAVQQQPQRQDLQGGLHGEYS